LKYKLLVFDWDGTLMDSQQEIVNCFQSAAKEINLAMPTEDEIHNVIGLGMFEAVQTVFPELDSKVSQRDFIEAYRRYYFAPDKPPSELFLGVDKMLRRFSQQDYFLAVATGKGRRGLDAVLARTGLDEIFHFTRCVDEAHSKPHPQMLLDIMDYLGVETNETLMIGDTEYDLQMASNANVHSVAVCCGAHDKSRLIKHNPQTCLNQSHELEAWLNN